VSPLPRFLSRRPPLVAPPELIDQPGLSFGLTVGSEPAGWTVTAYGADGRRLGRPLKGLSDPATTTLTATVERIQDSAARDRLAAAWVQVCRDSVTNADVLIGFSDAAAQIAGAPGPE
jgi:hypothetical protein